MYSFGKESKKHFDTLHPDLQELLTEAIKYVDFKITCGFRNEKDQNDCFDRGTSQLRWPHGEHNQIPSRAVDISPYPLNWNDSEAFTLLSGFIYGIACMKGIKIKLGADWDGDFNMLEHKFKDRPHINLI